MATANTYAPGVARQFLAHGSCAYHHLELRGVRAGYGFWTHSALAIRAQSRRGARGRADAFLALPRAPAWRAFARSRHHSWRCLGKLLLGQVLGLGPERNLGADCASLLHPGVARPARGLVDTVRPGCGKRCLFSRCVNGVV